MAEINSLPLPPNATPVERSLADLITGRDAALPTPVGATQDPDAIGAPLLPWLAWGLSVDVWDDEWTEEIKRAVTRGSVAHHRVKGTLGAMRAAARIAGGELVGAVVPPAKTFLAPTLTRAERDAFLSRYPELRIYHYRSRGERGAGAFCHRLFPGGAAYPALTDAVARWGEQVYYADGGVETLLTTAVRYREEAAGLAVEYAEVRAAGQARGVFAGGVLKPGAHVVAQDAGARMYRVRTETRYTSATDTIHLNAVKPGLETAGYPADTVAVAGRRRGLIVGAGFTGAAGASAPVASTARARLYDRLYLFDPARALEARGRTTHIGAQRLGMPPYHAELRVSLPGKRHARAAGRWVYGYTTRADPSRRETALFALASAKAARDRVLVSTSKYRPAVAGVQTLAGALVAGQWQEFS